jgi:hypothetical protein
MATQYYCKNEERRRLVGRTVDDLGAPIVPKLNGIDYLEVASVDQKTLKVFFLHNLPGQPNPIPPAAPALTAANVVIEGGVRIRDIKVVSVSSANNVLTVTVNNAGDFSQYTLRIVDPVADNDPPKDFDPRLSEVNFSFKVECPSDFDCEHNTLCPPEQFTEPEINYLAKDYSSFRRLVLDRISTLMPDWRERSAADAQIALVEMLAYVGDHLSYFQDAVATEAYLGTARRRISVRRHARALDYPIHDGTNARTWVCFEIEAAAHKSTLKENTKLFTRGSSSEVAVTTAKLAEVLSEQPVVFETKHDVDLNLAHNSISFYTWSDLDCCLPAGATKATLSNKGLPLKIKEGDVLIFEEIVSPTTGDPADADRAHRWAVRLTKVKPGKDPFDDTEVMDIEWSAQDALPFALCLTARRTPTENPFEVSVARGNVALADHGLTITGDRLIPDLVPEAGKYRPRLRLSQVTCPVTYVDKTARDAPASEALEQDVRKALPYVRLNDGQLDWTARRDLLNSDRFRADFVVELERDGVAHLRFGDGLSAGRKPDGGTQFLVQYRIGNGSGGNLGADALTRVQTDLKGFKSVRNPLPARGGTEPESLEQVRQFAPQAFRRQQRAVTEADWAEVTERHPDVQKAAASFRWTGSWYTVFITVDRKGGRKVKGDTKFRTSLENFLEQFRVAGYDLGINDPIPVPLQLKLRVCVKAGYFRSDVKQTLLNAFGRVALPAGGTGFFDPDKFTFGQPVYLSRIYETAMKVAGVASVEALVFQRFGKLANRELEDGRLIPAALEIVRLDNDPNFPENGQIEFEMLGGL